MVFSHFLLQTETVHNDEMQYEVMIRHVNKRCIAKKKTYIIKYIIEITV